MKTIRMIATSVIVFALVGTALSFTDKKLGAYCVSLTNDCQNSAVMHNLYFTNGIKNQFYKIDWDGRTATCVPTCCTGVRLETVNARATTGVSQQSDASRL